MVSKCHTCEAETRPIMRWHILSQSPGPFVWGLKMQPVQRVLQYAALRQTFAEQASLILCVRICQTPCNWHELFMEEQHPTIHFYDKPILAPELARVFQKWERRGFRRSRFRFLTNNTVACEGHKKDGWFIFTFVSVSSLGHACCTAQKMAALYMLSQSGSFWAQETQKIEKKQQLKIKAAAKKNT